MRVLCFLLGSGGRQSVGWFLTQISLSVPCLATEVEGTFRVNGSNKRMRELQAVFETPPRVRVSLTSPASPPLLMTTWRGPLVWQVTRLEEGELHDA